MKRNSILKFESRVAKTKKESTFFNFKVVGSYRKTSSITSSISSTV